MSRNVLSGQPCWEKTHPSLERSELKDLLPVNQNSKSLLSSGKTPYPPSPLKEKNVICFLKILLLIIRVLSTHLCVCIFSLGHAHLTTFYFHKHKMVIYLWHVLPFMYIYKSQHQSVCFFSLNVQLLIYIYFIFKDVNHVEIEICNNQISLTKIHLVKHFGKDSRAKHMTT